MGSEDLMSVNDKLYYVPIDTMRTRYVLSNNADISAYSKDFKTFNGVKCNEYTFDLIGKTITFISPHLEQCFCLYGRPFFISSNTLINAPIFIDGKLKSGRSGSVNREAYVIQSLFSALGYETMATRYEGNYIIEYGYLYVNVFRYSDQHCIYITFDLTCQIKEIDWFILPEQVRNKFHSQPIKVHRYPKTDNPKDDGLSYIKDNVVYVKIYEKDAHCFFIYKASEFLMSMIEKGEVHDNAIFNIMTNIVKRMTDSNIKFKKKHFKEIDRILKLKQYSHWAYEERVPDGYLYIEITSALAEVLSHGITI